MVKVFVFHYTKEGRLPKLDETALNDIMKNIYDELKKHPDVKFNGTYIDAQGRGICDWDAPDAEIVNEIVKKILGAAPLDGVAVVERVL